MIDETSDASGGKVCHLESGLQILPPLRSSGTSHVLTATAVGFYR